MSDFKNLHQKIINKYKLLRYELRVNNALKALLSVLLIVGVVAGAYLVEKGYRYFTGAATDPVELYFSPNEQNLPPNSRFSLMMDAHNNQIGFLRIDFDFDNTKVNLASELSTIPSLSTVVQKTSMAQANSTGHVTIVLGLSPGDTAPGGILEVASFDLTSVTSDSASTELAFDKSTMQIATLNIEEVPHNQITTDNGTLNLNQTTTSEARLYFSGPLPANPQMPGRDFRLLLKMDTGGQNVDGVDAIVLYDNNLLEVIDVTSEPGDEFASYPSLDHSIPGKVVVSANIGSGSNPSPVNGQGIVLGTITFRPHTNTSFEVLDTEVTYDFTPGDRNDSNVVLSGTTGDPVDILSSVTSVPITLTLGGTPTPTPTSTPFYWDGDINRDGIVNIIDVNLWRDNYRETNPNPPEADINNDGIVNVVDFSYIFTNWRKTS